MARVGVSQDIPNLAKRHAQQARAESDIKAAEADTAVEARSVEVGTALAWINLAYAQRRVAALDDLLSALERVVGTTQGAVASGGTRPAQTLAGQQAIAALADRRSELVANEARARAMLTRWTGDPTPEIAGTVPDFEITPSALRAGLDRHPAIRMIDAQAGRPMPMFAWLTQADARTSASIWPISAVIPALATMFRRASRSACRSSPVIARTRALPQLRPLPERSLPNARQRGALSKPISTPIWPIT
jgi:hypothetical protein